MSKERYESLRKKLSREIHISTIITFVIAALIIAISYYLINAYFDYMVESTIDVINSVDAIW